MDKTRLKKIQNNLEEMQELMGTPLVHKLMELKKTFLVTNDILRDMKSFDRDKQENFLNAVNEIKEVLLELNEKEVKLPENKDRADEIIKAIQESKIIIKAVEVSNLDKALEKIIPKDSEMPDTAVMDINNDGLWDNVTINYPSNTIDIGITRKNKVISKLTFIKT